MQATIELNGVRLFYDACGEGPAVLMIMGLGTPHVGWTPQLAAFRERYRAVAFDNRGCGRSSGPNGHPFTIRDMAGDALGLLDALRIGRAHVCGLSMGGMIAQELALAAPERVGALVLASTYATPGRSMRALAEENGQRFFTDPFAAMKRLVELTFSERYIETQGGAIMQLFARGSPNGPCFPGLLAQAAAIHKHDARKRLRAVRAPTLIITGDADALIPAEHSDELADLIPGARLEKIPGGSHGVSLERPAEWNAAVLGFLAEHDALVEPRKLAVG